MFKLTTPMGMLLAKFREQAGLSQSEVAERMGLSLKSGYKYISRLEKSQIKKPYQDTILNYLDAISVNWGTFFNELYQSRSKQNLERIMSRVKLPSYRKLQRKIDRDITLYANKIKGAPKTSVKIDVKQVKEKIKSKVLMLLAGHKTDDKLIPIYLDYTWHLFNREMNPNPNPPLDTKPWKKSGIKPILFIPISQIVHKTVVFEKKKLLKKPLSLETQEKMSVRFGNYRVKIEQIELAAHRKLNEIIIPEVLYPAYKAYARECYKAIRKYFAKDNSLLQQRIAEIKRAWTLNKLNPEILDKVHQTVFAEFQTEKLTTEDTK
jgi:transcriptional regulator with XRE-family HTH domain